MASPAPLILACATPPGRSPRALVRVSGDDLAPLVEALCHPPPPGLALQPTRIELPSLADRERTAPAGNRSPAHQRDALPAPSQSPLVPALASRFAAPRSYTGEDLLELQVPGNPALVDRLLRAILDRARSLGREARLAEPGEFTRRAFTAGRIDLTRAEGVAATIAATGDAELEAAALLRRGRLGQWAEALVDKLANLLALVEAGIDFVDQDDVVAIEPAALARGLAEIEGELGRLLDRGRAWAEIEAAPWVVLAGPPNAGKSTLFNALLGRRRAVESDAAGSTRDVLTEPLRLDVGGRALEVMLVDMAGLDEPTAVLDRAVQRAARGAIDRAELIIELRDRAAPPPAAPLPADKPRLAVHAKADLSRDGGADLNVSGLTGEGLEALREAIARRVADRAVAIGGRMLALQPRHRLALAEARDAIAEARTLDEPELLAATMRDALDHLGAVGGRMSPDEVIGRVFATFCIGK